MAREESKRFDEKMEKIAELFVYNYYEFLNSDSLSNKEDKNSQRPSRENIYLFYGDDSCVSFGILDPVSKILKLRGLKVSRHPLLLSFFSIKNCLGNRKSL